MNKTQNGVQLLAALGIYLLFKLIRAGFPPGLLKNSFPSFLFPLALLPCVEFVQGLRSSCSSRVRIALCGCIAAFLLEMVAPALGFGTADPADFFAILVGTALHLFLKRKWLASDSANPSD